jgi:acylphosphatase
MTYVNCDSAGLKRGARAQQLHSVRPDDYDKAELVVQLNDALGPVWRVLTDPNSHGADERRTIRAVFGDRIEALQKEVGVLCRSVKGVNYRQESQDVSKALSQIAGTVTNPSHGNLDAIANDLPKLVRTAIEEIDHISIGPRLDDTNDDLGVLNSKAYGWVRRPRSSEAIIGEIRERLTEIQKLAEVLTKRCPTRVGGS